MGMQRHALHRMDSISTDVKDVEEHEGLESLTQIRRTHQACNRPMTYRSSRVLCNTPEQTRIKVG